MDRVIEAERQARYKAKELSTAQQLRIKTNVVESYKMCFEYRSKLVECRANTFMTSFEEVS